MRESSQVIWPRATYTNQYMLQLVGEFKRLVKDAIGACQNEILGLMLQNRICSVLLVLHRAWLLTELNGIKGFKGPRQFGIEAWNKRIQMADLDNLG